MKAYGLVMAPTPFTVAAWRHYILYYAYMNLGLRIPAPVHPCAPKVAPQILLNQA